MARRSDTRPRPTSQIRRRALACLVLLFAIFFAGCINNRDDLLYFYTADIYDDIEAQTPPQAIASARTPITWQISQDTTNGTSITGSGPNNRVGTITVTNTPGTFRIRTSSSDGIDGARSLIVDTSNLDFDLTEGEYLVGVVDALLLPHMAEVAAFAMAFEEIFPEKKKDAARHLIWQALLAADSRLWAEAEKWGNAHEVSSVGGYFGGASGIHSGDSARSVSQDLHNNAIGREIGGVLRTASSKWDDDDIAGPIAGKIRSILEGKDATTQDPWTKNYSTVDPTFTFEPDVGNDVVRLE